MSGQVPVSFGAREARNNFMSIEESKEQDRFMQENRNISLESLDRRIMERRGTLVSQSSDDHNEPEKTISRSIKKSSRKKRGEPPKVRMVQSLPSSTNMEMRNPITKRHLHNVSSNKAEAPGTNSQWPEFNRVPSHLQNSEFSGYATNPDANSLLSSEFKRRFSHPQNSEFSGYATNPDANSFLSSEFKRRFRQPRDGVVDDHVKNPGENSLSSDFKRRFSHPHNPEIHVPVPRHVPVQNEKLEMLRRRRDKLAENYRQLSNRSLEGSSSNEGASSSNEGDRAPMTSIQEKKNDHKQCVLFSLVEIREYPRILGDNPSCRWGPPISLGWDYDKAAVVKVPVREFDEIAKKNKKKHFLLSRSEREGILFDEGYTRSQIAENARQMIKIRDQRRQTINNLYVARLEEALENVIRAIKKFNLYRRKGGKLLR
eukprot:scaffold16612_cov35-Attheya_sp.AAC.4